jgi:thiamine biosynthesis lipoprotein
LLALSLPACRRASSVTIKGETMGTTYTVKVVRLPKGVDADQLMSDIESTLAEINGLMSNYSADSELSRVNAHDNTDWFQASAEIVYVLERAREVSDASGGAFDVTVGPLVRLWNFGPGREGPGRIPDDAAIARTLEQIGHAKIELQEDPPKVRKLRADVEVDLSAVAKGFAVDEVENRLLSHGVTNYMVEIGGEVQTGGHNATGELWKIAVEVPLAYVRDIQRVVPLTQMAMATSGDYRNFFDIEDQRYSHILDPRTGRPADHNLVSVTVLHRSCTMADAWATALLVLGPDEGPSVAEREQLAVLFIMKTEDGFVERATKKFDEVVAEMGESPVNDE